jgi:hypothetical protein
MPPNFLRWTGSALATGGALTALINATLTPMTFLPGMPFDEVAASPAFLWRQCLSAVAAASLLFGTVGLYLAQDGRSRRFLAIAFVLAFLGSALLVAWEWVDIFLLHGLARSHPDTLRALEAEKGIGFYDLGGILAASMFALGWLAFAVATYRTTPALRRGAALVIAGFFVVPVLTAMLGPRCGALGNLVLGAGWVSLGRGVIAAGATPPQPSLRSRVGGTASASA